MVFLLFSVDHKSILEQLIQMHVSIGLWDHRMLWVESDLKDHLVPTPLP